MEWMADVSAGDWLRERLDAGWGSMHHVVPLGFAAYARVLHPATVRSLPGRPMPTEQDWNDLSIAEQERLIGLFVEEPATWADAAATFGTRVHPLAQWQHLVRTPPEGDWRDRIAPDGREFSSPDEGSLSPIQLAAIGDHLVHHTHTPDAGFAAVWEGFGGLVGFYGKQAARGFFDQSGDPNHQRMLNESIHNRFDNPFRKRTWQPGILSDEISRGPRLELPDRRYVLFSAAPRTFADPAWILNAPWRDREAEGHGFPPSAQHPNLLWPEDRAWAMVSEIDYDSTIVGGSVELVQALCSDPRFEALPLNEGADLSGDADHVNRAP